MKLIRDLGMQYPNENSKQKKRYGLYECPDCEKEVKACTYDVNAGRSNTCWDCAHVRTGKATRKHGDIKTRLYEIWCGMKKRCYNENSASYANYGGRGVAVCSEWKNDFVAFRDWSLTNGYDNELSLDKDKGSKRLGIEPPIYSPETCEWMTQSEQCRNTRELRSSNKTGIRGVHYCNRDDRWVASIGVDCKMINLGGSKNKEDAIKMRLDAEVKYGYL